MSIQSTDLIRRTDVVWYPLRVTYSREMALKEYLDTHHIENFLPMQYKLLWKNGKEVRKLVPVIHNLIFIHSCREVIDQLKTEAETRFPFRYIIDKEKQQPIVVPNSQMKHFIAVAGTMNDHLIYMDVSALHMKQGDRVRIKGGLFEGVEGIFLRVKGDRRVVVAIEGLMAVATTFIHPSLIEKLP